MSYDKALFCSKSYAGLNLEKIECGLYEIHIKILMRVGDVKELNLPKPELSNKNIHVSNKITQRIFYEEGILFYEKTKNDSFIARFLKKMIP